MDTVISAHSWSIAVLIMLGVLVTALAVMVWAFLRLQRKLERLSGISSVPVPDAGTEYALISQSMGELGERISSGITMLHTSQQHMADEMARMERSLGARITDVDRRSGESIQKLREDTFQSISRLNGEMLKLIQTLQQSSISGLHELHEALAGDMRQLREQLKILETQAIERRELEQQTARSIRRLETIIAGTQSKGAAGENIVEQVFSGLPPQWRVRNFRVNGRVVEFALRLPGGLILPIDSKWPATGLADRISAAQDPHEVAELRREIEKAVIQKASEARKYIEPSQTMPFAVIVVPDAIFDLSTRIHPEAIQLGVAVVSYSMFVPYLLLVIHTAMQTAGAPDVQMIASHLDAVHKALVQLQGQLDGRFSKALTMLNNARDDLRANLQKARAALISLEGLTDKADSED